jgi:hypothetical protein
VLALDLHDTAEPVQAEDGGLAAVPGKQDLGARGHGDLLRDVVFKQFAIHAEDTSLRVQGFFGQVITVAAVEVADRARRLGKNLKIAGCPGGGCHVSSDGGEVAMRP